jgi:GNAT superfamily N-acetyltransferase
MHIRPAQLDEHEALSRIAHKAKAHWGYRPEDLTNWHAELTVSPESLAQHPTFVAEVQDHIAGFFQLSFPPEGPELEHMWVLPNDMGQGIGRGLLERAILEVAKRGHDRLLIDADPNAERFYVACGAVRIGDKPAPAVGQPQRVRPQLVLIADATTA